MTLLFPIANEFPANPLRKKTGKNDIDKQFVREFVYKTERTISSYVIMCSAADSAAVNVNCLYSLCNAL